MRYRRSARVAGRMHVLSVLFPYMLEIELAAGSIAPRRQMIGKMTSPSLIEAAAILIDEKK